MILTGISELRTALQERYRFDWLIGSLEAYEFRVDYPEEGALLWEWRVAFMVFVDALCNSPVDLEVRCELRGELERRGLGSAIQVGKLSWT